MATYFSPETVRSIFDISRDDPVTIRLAGQNFTTELVRILRKLRNKMITGNFSVSGVAIGASSKVFVDHASTEIFGFAEQPVFTPILGVDITIMAMASISGVQRGTSGSGFCVKVENVNSSDMAGAGATLNWSRSGIPL